MSDVRTYLESKGLRLRSAGPDDVNTPCFYCNEPDNKRGRLYINVGSDDSIAGLHMCHLCGTKGNLITLRRHFGDPVESPMDDTSQARRHIFESATDFYVAQMTDETIEYLTGPKRGLTKETIEKYRLGWAPGEAALGRHLHNECGFDVSDIKSTGLVVEYSGQKPKDFLQRVITIPYLMQGSCVQIRGKDINGKYVTPPGQKARLYNTDSVWTAENIFVTEGEFDALVLEQNGYPAVGAPGAVSWQDSWRSYFDEAKRVYVVFDNDTKGNEGAEKLKDVFGIKYKRVLLPKPDDQDKLDVTEWFSLGGTREVFDDLCREAQGEASLLITPRQAYEQWQEIQGVDGFKLGFESIDLALSPGLLPSQVAVVLAKTNTGKTIALLNIFERALMVKGQEDANILFLSLEQTRGEWFERAQRIHNFFNIDTDERDVQRVTVDYWTPRLRIVDKNRVSEEELLACLEDYKAEMGKKPDLVAVDYLGYWAAGFKGKDRYERVTDAIMSLKAVGKEWMVPIISPHQVNRTAQFGADFEIDQARDAGTVEETADLIFTFWSVDAQKASRPEDRTGQLKIKVGKARSGGKGQEFDLRMGAYSLAIVTPEEAELDALALSEVKMANNALYYGRTWRDVMLSHRSGTRLEHIPKDRTVALAAPQASGLSLPVMPALGRAEALIPVAVGAEGMKL